MERFDRLVEQTGLDRQCEIIAGDYRDRKLLDHTRPPVEKVPDVPWEIVEVANIDRALHHLIFPGSEHSQNPQKSPEEPKINTDSNMEDV